MPNKKRKRKRQIKPWCYFCDRTFDDEKVLINHQKAKHFKCPTCNKKFGSGSGMATHVLQVHKSNLETVPNSIAGRDTFQYDVVGMEGIPLELQLEKEGYTLEEIREYKKQKTNDSDPLGLDDENSNAPGEDEASNPPAATPSNTVTSAPFVPSAAPPSNVFSAPFFPTIPAVSLPTAFVGIPPVPTALIPSPTPVVRTGGFPPPSYPKPAFGGMPPPKGFLPPPPPISTSKTNIVQTSMSVAPMPAIPTPPTTPAKEDDAEKSSPALEIMKEIEENEKETVTSDKKAMGMESNLVFIYNSNISMVCSFFFVKSFEMFFTKKIIFLNKNRRKKGQCCQNIPLLEQKRLEFEKNVFFHCIYSELIKY